MKYVFAIEDDERFQREIYEALAAIDPKLQVRFFRDFESFELFAKNLTDLGISSVHKAGFPCSLDKNALGSALTGEAEVRMLIFHEGFLGPSRFDYLQSLQKTFLEKKLCTVEEPTAIIFTGFDRPEFNIREFEREFISNVIYKPFDKLILQEHLFMALVGRRPAKASLVHKMKTSVEVEMIKDIDPEAFSDIGFVTRSALDIQVGHIAKYYSGIFEVQKKNYVYARCWKTEKHPELEGQFRCWFTFIGSDPTAHAEYRRKLSLRKAPEAKFKKAVPRTDAVFLALIDPDDARRRDLKSHCEKNMKQSRVIEFSSWDQFMMRVDPLSTESQQKGTAWNGENPVSFVLDPGGKQILSFDPPHSETTAFLGMKGKELKDLDFQRLIPDVSLAMWTKMISKRKVSPGLEAIIQVKTAHGFFLLKCDQMTEVRNAKGQLTGIRIVLKKPQIQEKATWYQQYFTLKDPIQGVICPFESIKAGGQSWTVLRESVKAKSKVELMVMGFTENPLAEEKLRELPEFVSDVICFQHDRTELMRKLCVFLNRPMDENFKYHQITEATRVALPIQLVELSESCLIMKYNRTLPIGGFRKFVLPKATGGEVLEYLATCNYNEVDKNDKNIVNNYFIFFGITDAYLKNIRVWMRDNYAHAKEKAAG